jgi:hypothetical protein
MRVTPTNPTTIPMALRLVTGTESSTAMAMTVAMAVVALPIPANAEGIRVSAQTKQVNGKAPRKNPHTARWPQTRRSLGRRPRVSASRPSSVSAASRMRAVTICQGVNPRRATIMRRKLDPQTRTRVTHLSCQGARPRLTRRPR